MKWRGRPHVTETRSRCWGMEVWRPSRLLPVSARFRPEEGGRVSIQFSWLTVVSCEALAPSHDVSGGCLIPRLVIKAVSARIRREPNGDHAERIDERAESADHRIAAVQSDEQRAGDEHADGRGEPAGAHCQAGAGSADARGKQLRQVERQPAKEQRGQEALREHHREKRPVRAAL